jgi:tetraprenyl-beta-curcumene synthase
VCRQAPSVRRFGSRWRLASQRRGSAPATLSGRQLQALAAAVTRGLAWITPAVSQELQGWRHLAASIPARPLREEALAALERKRGQSEGAALFALLPRQRSRACLRLLVAYQLIWDYLDSVNERGVSGGVANGRQLHLALVDALTPGTPVRDYYQHNPWKDDGGYLRALVKTCRECCVLLPSFPCVQPLALADARRAQVLALNHEPDAGRRDAALEAWVEEEFPSGHNASWFEMTGAASAALAMFSLLALACERTCSEAETTRTHAAYFWVSLTATMLDSYADQHEDLTNNDHIYIAHYATAEIALARICELVRKSLAELNTLQGAETHQVITCSMIALYLSKDSARSRAMRDSSKRIAHSGGPLTQVLLPILRLWRIAHSLGAS